MEILIVVAIFAIISAISYTTLARYLDITTSLEQKGKQLLRIQKTFTRLERDFRFLVNRSVRDQYGEVQSAFLVNNPAGSPGERVRITAEQPDYRIPGVGRLQRVAWRLDNSILTRDTLSNLDQDSSGEWNSVPMLKNISNFDIEQFSWSDQYGVQQDALGSEEGQMPYGIRVTITLENGFEYSRLFDIANGS